MDLYLYLPPEGLMRQVVIELTDLIINSGSELLYVAYVICWTNQKDSRFQAELGMTFAHKSMCLIVLCSVFFMDLTMQN